MISGYNHLNKKEIMQVILHPLTGNDKREIVVENDLLQIGRLDLPFSAYAKEQVKQLSRRHARLFLDQGRAYLTDFGSKNGTRLNGQGIGRQPVELQHDDELCFGQALCFKVEFRQSEESLDDVKLPELRLTLVPSNPAAATDAIVVEGFPFLIGKSQPAFSSFAETQPQEHSYLSRRHAHIFRSGGKLLIEDLGSTNGTFISGMRISSEAQPLEQGSTVAFGGDYYVYRVLIEHLQERAEDDLAATRMFNTQQDLNKAPAKTIFVETADSFLDIFCADDQPESDDTEDRDSPQRSQNSDKPDLASSPHQPKKESGVKPLLFLEQLKEAFTTNTGDRRRWPLVIAGLLISAVIGGAYYSYQDKGKTGEIADLIDAQEYRKGALLADHYLQASPDSELAEIATEALIKLIVPEWLDQIDSADYPSAETKLNDADSLVTSNSEGKSTLDVLRLLTKLEGYIAGRGGLDAPINLLEAELPIQSILTEWDRERNKTDRVLERIAKTEPEFEPRRSRVYSQIRWLRKQNTVEIPAISQLLDGVSEDIKQARDPSTRFDAFAVKYPKIDGLKTLREDWLAYNHINQMIGAGRYQKAIALMAGTEIRSPLFRQALAELQQNAMPSESEIDRLTEAETAWRSGDMAQALKVMRELSQGRLAENSSARLQRMERILTDYAALNETKDTGPYNKRLLKFYAELHEGEDDFFIQAVQQDYDKHRARALDFAAEHSKRAMTGWQRYQRQGPIVSLLRLEAKISQKYRQLAEILSTAFREAGMAREAHDALRQEYPEVLERTYDALQGELELQRRSLRELSTISTEKVLRSKLRLLGWNGADNP